MFPSNPPTPLRHTGLQCPICRMRMFSWFRHDYRTCFCGAIMVDGGFDYFRCGWEPGTGPVRSIYWTQKDWAPDWYTEGYLKRLDTLRLARRLRVRG